MKKTLLFLYSIFFYCSMASAQNPVSFFLDTMTFWNRAEFKKDVIYFYSYHFLCKTDYQGNIIWTKRTPESIFRMKISDNAIYGLSGLKLFKMDTAANIIWVKNFSSPVYSGSTFRNNFKDIVCDGGRIYLSEIQDTTAISVRDYYPAILVLDTAGNILNVNYQHITPGGSFQVQPCIRSLKGGAWIGYSYAPGFTSDSHLARIDSNGDFDTTANRPVFFFSTVTDIQQIITMPDSTYLVLNNAIDYNSNNPGGFFTLSKIDEGGNIKWQYAYYDSTFNSGTHSTFGGNVICDSSNNIYVIGNTSQYQQNGSFYSGSFAMKLDNSGNVLFTKFWTPSKRAIEFMEPNSEGFNCLHYTSGHIYWVVNYNMKNYYSKPALLVFDTLFSNSCYDPDSTISIYKTFLWNFPGANNPSAIPISYSPVNDNIIVSPMNLVGSDLCRALEVKDIFRSTQGFKIFPNPLTSSSILQLNTLLKNAEVVIYDLLGKEMLRKKMDGDRMEIEKGSLGAGVYFVRVSAEEKQFVQKIIIE